MPLSCAAYNCVVRFQKGSQVKFHKFPKNVELQQQWVTAVGRKDYKPSATAVICSNHFKAEDYYINPYGTKVLKKGVVPSVFDFTKRPRKKASSKKALKDVTYNELPTLPVASSSLNSSEGCAELYVEEKEHTSLPPVDQTSLTSLVPQTSVTSLVPQKSVTPVVTETSVTSVVPQTSVTSAIPQTSITSVIPQTSVTSVVPQTSFTSSVPQMLVFSLVPQTSVFSLVPPTSVTSSVPQESVTSSVPEASVEVAHNPNPTFETMHKSSTPNSGTNTHKRKRSVHVNVGDFEQSDLENPRDRQKYWDLSQAMIEKYRKTNKYLRCKLQRNEKKIAKLNGLLEDWKKKYYNNLKQTYLRNKNT